jgi:hypothetical protein
MIEMHDWTLQSISYEWKDARAVFVFKSEKSINIVIAKNVSDLHVPQTKEWGPSVSVNKVVEAEVENGMKKMTIEMQSGDIIAAVAASFSLELS